MSRVFLCHNSKDERAVGHLSRRLKANGVDAWSDKSGLKGGAGWQTELAEALVTASAVVVCLGRHGVGPWQEDEIELARQTAKESDMAMIPLILPTCGETTPDIPLWLRTLQSIDLREDTTDTDPFGRLLKAIDSRDPAGHHRPTVAILGNPDDPSSREARERVVDNCHAVLQRVRPIDPNEPLFEQNLGAALRHCDLLLTLLDADSHTPRRIETFKDGVAAGVKRLAAQAGVEVIQWRSDTLEFPAGQADRFRSDDTETCKPSHLAQDVTQTTENRFNQRVGEHAIANNQAEDASAKPHTVPSYFDQERKILKSLEQSRNNEKPLQDSTLVERLKNLEDHDSWKAFFETYWKLIYGAALTANLSDADAQEVVQEVIVSVSRNIQTFKADSQHGSFKAWLLEITQRRIADQYRKKQRREDSAGHDRIHSDKTRVADQAVDSSLTDIEEHWEAKYEAAIVESALANMKKNIPPGQYRIFHLAVVRGRPVSEIRESLGVTANMIYLAKHHVTNKVAEEIERLREEYI